MSKQIVNLEFNFEEMLNIDLQDFHSKNKEMSFIIDAHHKIISIRKGAEMNEAKASANIGNFKNDFIEIFIWNKKDFPDHRKIEFDYNNARKTADKIFLLVIENGTVKEFKHNENDVKCFLECEQDEANHEIKILLKEALRSQDNHLNFGPEKILSKGQKSIDVINALFE